MRTQGEHSAEVRLSISGPSAEKTDSQIYRLKQTDQIVQSRYHMISYARARTFYPLKYQAVSVTIPF